MIFSEVAVDEAEGMILAHSIQTPDGVIMKGRVLAPDDIAAIRSTGTEVICAARIQPGDMREDDVAIAVARALSGRNVEGPSVHAGRCNLHARVHGVCVLNREAIDAVNRAGTGILISTVSPNDVVGASRAVATVKVVPYAVNESIVRAICDGLAPMDVYPFRSMRAGLILTEVAGGKPSLLEKARMVVASRLETYGSRLQWHRCVPHKTQAVADAIASMHNDGAEVILVLGAASASDRADVVPAAIEAAGGTLQVFGIPVDPGNLLAAGRLGDVPVIGLPGCARSPRLNGVDLVLPRLFAGLDVSSDFLLGLGVGGMLSDISDRPQPREDHSHPAPKRDGAHTVAAIVLAAGASRRMGERNKLLMETNGLPMVRKVVETIAASAVHSITVVTGFEADMVRAALDGLNISIAHNPRFMEGLSSSVKAGIRCVPEDVDGALMVLGDMPCVDGNAIDQVLKAFAASGGQSICVPTYQGRRGNPVLWPREFFADILDLSGDMGARRLLDRFANRVTDVPIDRSGVLIDIDTPEDLNGLSV